mmetsp:Transcript_24179/g.43699  ORF Transcript_24179/g.43699 Transcript_24179/m.43699 type:complete len:276 (+) Transcript_24179:2236-3063(+)
MAIYHPLDLTCQTMVPHMEDCPPIMMVVLGDTGAAAGATEAEHIAAARPLVDPETAGMKWVTHTTEIVDMKMGIVIIGIEVSVEADRGVTAEGEIGIETEESVREIDRTDQAIVEVATAGIGLEDHLAAGEGDRHVDLDTVAAGATVGVQVEVEVIRNEEIEEERDRVESMGRRWHHRGEETGAEALALCRRQHAPVEVDHLRKKRIHQVEKEVEAGAKVDVVNEAAKKISQKELGVKVEVDLVVDLEAGPTINAVSLPSPSSNIKYIPVPNFNL